MENESKLCRTNTSFVLFDPVIFLARFLEKITW